MSFTIVHIRPFRSVREEKMQGHISEITNNGICNILLPRRLEYGIDNTPRYVRSTSNLILKYPAGVKFHDDSNSRKIERNKSPLFIEQKENTTSLALFYSRKLYN